MTKTDKLLKALRSGKELSAAEIKQKFGLANPYQAISNLRQKKIAVYGNTRTLRNGEKITKYRIGTPTATLRELGFTS